MGRITTYLKPLNWRLMAVVWMSLLLPLVAQKASGQNYNIGSGTTSNDQYTYPSPFGSWYSGQHAQYMYRASELIAAGMTPGNLHQLAFNVIATNGSGNHGDYSISIVGTSATSLATPISTGWVTVYSSASQTPTLGWNTFTMGTPFNWNGTDNIVVKVCHWNGPSTYTYNASVEWTTGLPANTSFSYWSDSGGPFCSNYSLTNSVTNTTRPNIRFIRLNPCAGTPTASVAPAGPITACVGSQQILTANVPVAAGYTYQWQDSSTAGWANITTNANASSYTVNVTGPKAYRVIVCCSISSLCVTSASVYINAGGPTYGTVPYFTSFETWTNYCATNDVPTGGNWTNQPATGNDSWRRNDQGSSANWTNIFGNYSPTSKHGSYSAQFHSYSSTYNVPGNLDLYLDCSGTTGPKQLYFHMINDGTNYYYDSLKVFMSTNGGASFTSLGGFDTTLGGWRQKTLPVNSNSATTVLRFQGKKGATVGTTTYTYDYTDIGLDSVYIATPCTGTPTAGNILPGGGIGCPGASYALSLNGASLAGNLQYQWEMSAVSSTGPWTNVGTNSPSFTTPGLTDTVWYRTKVTCLGSSLFAYTNAIQFSVPEIQYAAIPYVEDFESWISRCSTTDVPSASWTNLPFTGNNSWRRNDQGASAAWTTPTGGVYAPTSVSGSYSARFHSYYATAPNLVGRMDLHVNCATITGNKELQFYLNMSNASTFATDSLFVQYSTNGGASFTQLAGYDFTSNGGWELKSLVLPSNSATTVVRFQAKSYPYYYDIGLDLVKILPPCAGAPTAGTINPVTPCANANFNLTLNGSTQAAGLTYQWQSSTTGQPGSFTNISAALGGTNSILNTSIATPTYFQVVVTCTNGNQSSTTPPILISLAPFYNCYCPSVPLYTSLGNVGNVTIQRQPSNQVILNNGNATPATSNTTALNTYSNFTNLTPTPLYLDSLYRGFITQIGSSTVHYAGLYAIWIDYSRDGVYQSNERVLFQTGSNIPVPVIVNDTFRIPGNIQTGITGMRVKYVYATSSVMSPCGSYNYGETEDYLVNISYPPCNGPANAGTALISDTTICFGYALTLTDTTHEYKRSNIVWNWQRSTNGGSSWSNVTGSTGKDTLQLLITQAQKFRFRMICTITGDTSYSNEVEVKQAMPYQCYCYSIASPNNTTLDSTDVGAFKIGNFIMNTGGPHLLNPMAVRSRTDYTNVAQINLWADSTYPVNVFHTMRAMQHKNAKVTLFIDYDNNLQYDAPRERVLTGFSTANNWFLIGSVTIPHDSIITDLPTGMRLIINEDMNPSNASDAGCGTYTSGETEDYVVILRNQFSTGVATASLVREMALYPNPTTGRAVVTFRISKPVNDLQLVVSDLTGRTLSQTKYDGSTTQIRAEIDLAGQARGVYFVEVRADGEKLVRKLIVQ